MDKLKINGKLSYGEQLYANILEHPFKKNYRMISKDKSKVLINYSCMKEYLIENHWHTWIEFAYVLKGQVLITAGANQYILNRGDFILVNIGEIHSTYTLKDSHIITLQVSQDYIAKHFPFYFKNINLCSVYKTTDNEYKYEEIAKIFFEIIKRFDNENAIECFGCDTYIDLFFYKIISFFQHKEKIVKKTKHNDILSKICLYINRNYQDNITLNDIATEFNVSAQYLSKIFKQYMNTTFHEYLISVRLNQAVFEITNTDYNIITIGYNCGFPNKQSFINHFKKRYKLTPLQFRKKTHIKNWSENKEIFNDKTTPQKT